MDGVNLNGRGSEAGVVGVTGCDRWKWKTLGCLAALVYLACIPCRGIGMTLSELQSLHSPGNISVDGAPDGAVVAVGWNNSIDILDLEHLESVRDLGLGFDPQWAPNSRWLAFYSMRSGTLQLWVWNRATNHFAELTHDAGGLDIDPTTRVAGDVLQAFRIAWSPDGSFVAIASRVATKRPVMLVAQTDNELAKAPGAPIVLTSSTPLYMTMKGILVSPGLTAGAVPFSDDGWDFKTRQGEDMETQIRTVNVYSGTEKWVTGGAFSHFDPAWSPDGRLLACVKVRGAGMTIQTTETQIEVIASPSGVVREITAGPGVKASPLWMSADSIAFLRRSTTFAWPTAFVANTAHREEPIEITALSHLHRWIAQLSWSARMEMFLVSYRDGVSEPLALVPRRGTPAVLTQAGHPLAVYGFTTLSRGAVAWIQSDPQDLWTLKFLAKPGYRPVTLFHFTHVSKKLELGSAKIIQWRNSRGDVLQGTVLLPPNFAQGQRYPLIVDAYPRIGGSEWTSPMLGNYAWASAGYVIFRPSPPAPIVRGEPWRTKASSTIASGPKGWAITVDDVMSGVDHLVEEGMVDPKRMCLYGWTNGGGVVAYLVTQVHRFRCAVSTEPALADMVRPFLFSPGTPVSWFDNGKSLDSGLSDYIALSSVFHMAAVKTPMLLADGDNDGDFLLDSVEIYNQLRQLGKSVIFVRYPNQGHGFTGGTLSDFWVREMAFFAHYLTPGWRIGINLPLPQRIGQRIAASVRESTRNVPTFRRQCTQLTDCIVQGEWAGGRKGRVQATGDLLFLQRQAIR